MPAATSELYLRFVAQGVQESSRHLEGFAKAAVNADRQFQDLQRTAGTAWARNMAREAGQATAQLERMKRVMAEGRVSVFFSDLTTGFQRVGRLGAAAFTSLALGVGGYIHAGMQGTAESIQLNRAIQDINYSVASIFTPQIHKAIDGVQRLASMLMNLTGAQQQSIREWVAGALALSGFLALLPKVTAGMALLTRLRGAAAAAGAVQAAVGPAAATAGPAAAGAALAGQVSGGLGLLRGVAGAAGVLALIGSSEEGRRALVELAKAAQPLLSAFGKLAEGLSKTLGPAIEWLAIKIRNFADWLADRIPALGAAGAGEDIIKANQGEIEAIRKQLKEGGTRVPTGLFSTTFAKLSAEARADLEKRLKALEAGGGPPGKAKDMLEPHTPGFEQPADLYRRIAEAASGQRRPEDITAEKTTSIARVAQAIYDALLGMGLKVPPDRPGEG